MSSRPRVLEVLQPEDGGVAEHVFLLARGLSERGFEVEVAASATNAIRPALEAAGIVAHAIPIERAPGAADARAAFALARLDRRGRYDLVHAHSSKAGALVRATLPYPKRFAYTPHCFAFAVPGDRSEALFYRAVERALVRRTAAIVTVAEWERGLAERLLPEARDRLRLIPNGVPPCADAEPAPELLEFAGGRPLAGLIAVLRPQKDPLGLVGAAALLAARSPDVGRVAIVGNGWLEAEVRAEIRRLGASEVVRWFPFEGGGARYLSALDLFVLPSRWEALPIGLLEAMRCGLPALATRVGGVPELVLDGETGVLVDPGRPDALAEGLGGLLADPERRRALGTAGRERAAEHFDADRMVDATAELYKEILAGPNTAQG